MCVELTLCNAIWTGSPRSMRRFCTRRVRPPTCTSVGCSRFRGRRPISRPFWTTSAAGCTWFHATGRSWPPRRSSRVTPSGSTTPRSISNTTSDTPRCRPPEPRSSFSRWWPGSSPSRSTARVRCGRTGSSRGSRASRFALISKTHHSLVDGVAGVDLATVLFDAEPDPAPAETSTELEPWQPHPEPSRAELVLGGVRGLVGAAAGLAGRFVSAAAASPEATLVTAP